MSSFRFGIPQRVAAGFAAVLVVMIGLVAVSINRVGSMERHLTEINEVNSVLQRYAINYRGSVHDRAIAIRDVVLLENVRSRAEQVRLIETLASDYATNHAAMSRMIGELGADPAQAAALADIDRIEARTNPLVAQIIQLRGTGDVERASTLLMGEASPLFSEWLAAINRFIDHQEALNQNVGGTLQAEVAVFSMITLGTLLFAGIVSVLVGWAVSRSVARPARRLSDAMISLAKGDLKAVVPDTDRNDEIGDMAKSVAVFKDALINQRRLEGAQKQQADLDRLRQTQLEKLIAEFRSQISLVMETMNGEVRSTDAASLKVRSATAEATANADASNVATDEASSAVASVSAAVEELVSSISEIARQTETANKVAREAVRVGKIAEATVKELETAADHIGQVVGLINDIAEQTNLLALNATIEAARAGEAGKGFAVVASEVKSLAQQTSKATGEISSQIEAVQDRTSGTVKSLRDIMEAVARVEEFSGAIATAVEEQTAVTNEIASSAQVAAIGTTKAAQTTRNVRSNISETSQQATDLKTASGNLTKASSALQDTIDAFLSNVSADAENRRREMRMPHQEVVVTCAKGDVRKSTTADISRTGVQILGLKDLGLGAPVRIDFSDDISATGVVVRHSETGVGIEFDKVLSRLPNGYEDAIAA